MQQIIQSKTTSGYKKQYISIYDRGNLSFLIQRLDIGIIRGDKQYSDKLFLKNGKVKDKKSDFIAKEKAQSFYTNYADTIKEIRKFLLIFEIRKRKILGNYNIDYHLHEDVKQVVEIHRRRI